jgi:hypothetical protein
MRLNAFDHDNCVWVLPLTPRHLFVAANSRDQFLAFVNATATRLTRHANTSKRYVFTIDDHLRPGQISDLQFTSQRLREERPPPSSSPQ